MTSAFPPKKLVVCHVCAGNLYGGIESMLCTVARESGAGSVLRHEFACCFEGRFSSELQAIGAPVHRLRAVRLSRPWEILRARRVLRSTLERIDPDIVVTHSAWTRLVFGGELVRNGRPSVAWVHAATLPVTWMDRLGQSPQPSLVVVNSKYTNQLSDGLFPAVRRELIYCPVPNRGRITPGDRIRLRGELSAHPGTVVILMAARFESWKGHQLLLQGLARLDPKLDWVCWIAGGAQTPVEAAFRTGLDSAVRALGLSERVKFLGERRDVPELMGAADLYCQPNTGPEPFGIVFVEALFAGTPVVSTGLGGVQEIVTNECGRLVSSGDAQALAAALTELILKPDLRSQLAANGAAHADELCNPARQCRRLDAIFSSLKNAG